MEFITEADVHEHVRGVAIPANFVRQMTHPDILSHFNELFTKKIEEVLESLPGGNAKQ